ncbi:DUF5343 domain-containing protein [Tabrizicola sp.]|uniref:DUF5343 domain-containing protein n=1 Tax=Tabrizicola sp. TaxID=2005166 RepID=UPI003D289593
MNDGDRPSDQTEAVGSEAATPKEVSAAQRAPAREIKGSIPYSPSPGSITAVLDAIVNAERPDKFSNNFMESVLSQSGGGARSVPPLLKKMGFLTSDGTPTDLYSKFKTDSGRAMAAFLGLKSAFGEVFRKNEFAHKVSEDQVKDILIDITGLKKSDPVLRLMYKSFEAVKNYIPADFEVKTPSGEVREEAREKDEVRDGRKAEEVFKIGLAYQINIVLPETQDQMVYDAIFKSLKRNLLA